MAEALLPSAFAEFERLRANLVSANRSRALEQAYLQQHG